MDILNRLKVFFGIIYLFSVLFGFVIGCACYNNTVSNFIECVYDKYENITLFDILIYIILMPFGISVLIGKFVGMIIVFIAKHSYRILNNFVIIRRK